jgi:hypothetical protein
MTKLILSNWIHLLGFYLIIEISTIIHIATSPDAMNWQESVGGLLLGAPFLMLSYGLIFIIGFLLVIVILDILLFFLPTNNRKFVIILVLSTEWLLIVPIFIYWAFEYNYWLWIYLSASFLITQIIKSRRVKGILLVNG